MFSHDVSKQFNFWPRNKCIFQSRKQITDQSKELIWRLRPICPVLNLIELLSIVYTSDFLNAKSLSDAIFGREIAQRRDFWTRNRSATRFLWIEIFLFFLSRRSATRFFAFQSLVYTRLIGSFLDDYLF